MESTHFPEAYGRGLSVGELGRRARRPQEQIKNLMKEIIAYGKDAEQFADGGPHASVTFFRELPQFGLKISKTYRLAQVPEGERFVGVSVGRTHSCGLRDDGSLLCWGRGSETSTAPQGGRNAKVVSAGQQVWGLGTDRGARTGAWAGEGVPGVVW